jgi:hypothetical protein
MSTDEETRKRTKEVAAMETLAVLTEKQFNIHLEPNMFYGPRVACGWWEEKVGVVTQVEAVARWWRRETEQRWCGVRGDTKKKGSTGLSLT